MNKEELIYMAGLLSTVAMTFEVTKSDVDISIENELITLTIRHSDKVLFCFIIYHLSIDKLGNATGYVKKSGSPESSKTKFSNEAKLIASMQTFASKWFDSFCNTYATLQKVDFLIQSWNSR